MLRVVVILKSWVKPGTVVGVRRAMTVAKPEDNLAIKVEHHIYFVVPIHAELVVHIRDQGDLHKFRSLLVT